MVDSLSRRAGWERVVASLEELHAFVTEEQERAVARLEKSGEEPIEMAVALGAFDIRSRLRKRQTIS